MDSYGSGVASKMVNHGPSYIDAYEAGKRVMTWRNDPEAIGAWANSCP